MQSLAGNKKCKDFRSIVFEIKLLLNIFIVKNINLYFATAISPLALIKKLWLNGQTFDKHHSHHLVNSIQFAYVSPTDFKTDLIPKFKAPRVRSGGLMISL